MKTVELNEQQVRTIVEILQSQDYSPTYDAIVKQILKKLNEVEYL